MKRIPSIFLSLILVFSMMPLAVFAESAAGSVTSDTEDVFAFENSTELKALRKEAKSFDDAFDLREYGTVTSVKQQTPFGTCWGFAAVAAAESSLLASGIAQQTGYDENTLDLSEKHLAYFATSYLDDPDDPQNGEGIHYNNPTGKATQKYDMGGDAILATGLFASGVGPVLESKSSLLEYRGINGEKVTRRVATAYDAEGNPTEFRNLPVWYSEEDDWSIPEEYRYSQSYRLKESYDLPNPTATGTDLSKEEGILAIKHQLLKEP